MCTVSIISIASPPGLGVGGAVGDQGGYRLVTNRDEQRARAPAIEPTWLRIKDLKGGPASDERVLAPRDPVGGGTWVATTERGMTLCLLNGNLEPAPKLPASLRSRGEIIPSLVGLGTVERVMEAIRAIDLSVYAPFRLVGVEPRGKNLACKSGGSVRTFDAFWDRSGVACRVHDRSPLCFVSSGLGDSRVLPRLPLFERMVGPDPTPGAQDAFHAHVWPTMPEISVCMSRAEARTVSITSIEVRALTGGGALVDFAYRPIPDPS